METLESEICEYIVSLLQKSGQPIRGAQLGSLIHLTFSGLSLQARYGGLRRFTEDHCAPTVLVSSRDDSYALPGFETREPHVANSRPNSTPAFVLHKLTAWSAFSNPNLGQILSIDLRTGELLPLPTGQPVPDGFTEIPKLNGEDYRHMARQFVLTLDPRLRADFDSITHQEYFWPAWSQILQRYTQQGIFDSWLSFRGKAIEQQFEQRLDPLDIEPAAKHYAFQEFRNSRTVLPKSEPRNTLQISNPTVATPQTIEAGGTGIREIVRAAIECMTDDELRQLWLPLGSIQDAIKAVRR